MVDSSDKVILVTGGAGFIGSNFIHLVLGSLPSAKVVCLDALTYAGNKDNLAALSQDRLTFVKGSITNRELVDFVLERHKPTHIINFAAESHVDRSIHFGADSFVDTNARGVSILLESLKQSSISVERFVQVGTDEVYGSLGLETDEKFTETSQLAPNSPYAASKAAGDLIARSYFSTHRLPVVITRCANNYGPFQYPEKLIPYSILRLVNNEPIAMYGDGKNVRDWIHVIDHAEALLEILFKGKPGDIYNIGASEEIDNLAIARHLLNYFGKDDSHIEFVTDRPGHDRRYAIDATKVRSTFGWAPRHSFSEALNDTIEWYLKNDEWVKKILARTGKTNTHI